MADKEQLYQALRNADAAGDTEGAKKLAGYIQSLSAPIIPEKSLLSQAGDAVKNTSIGVARGIKDVIDTGAQGLANTYDYVTGSDKPTLTSLVTGQKMGEGARIRAMNQQGNTDYNKSYGDSSAASMGRIGGNIIATLPVGGILGAGVKAIAPGAIGLSNALASGGMRAGSTPGMANMLTRIAGGAGTGAASAGLVDPNAVAEGSIIGAALPVGVKAAGKIGAAIGRTISGPAMADSTLQGAKAATDLGYVIPPSQVKPTLANRTIEGFAGKISTAQNASLANQGVTNSLIQKGLGLPADQPLTVDALKAIRNTAGAVYDAVGTSGLIKPTQAYSDALDKIIAPYQTAASGFPGAKPNPIIAEITALKSPEFDASSALAKIKELREGADSAYGKGDKDIGKALKSAANALEDTIDTHLQQTGAAPDVLQKFRDARQLIAKTYSIENALNPTSGNVDANKLAAALKKGKPLSGELKQVAEFAGQFPKATQIPEKMGSLPQVSPLDFSASALTSAATANPLYMAGVLARPAVRKLALSGMIQNKLSTPVTNSSVTNALSSPQIQQILYRGAPVLSSDR